MTEKELLIHGLEQHAKNVRLNIIDLVGVGRAGHLGGSCSAADIITSLYFYKMSYDAKNPHYEGRDRVLLSKGHAALCQYAALCELGVIDHELLPTIKSLGSKLQGHPDSTKCPGIEANTGSLGQGLSISLGMALGLRLDGSDNRVYCIVGDGELDEGQIWEAVMAAVNFKADNLVCIVDNNHVQATDTIVNTMNSGNLPAKFKAFGWHVIETNGHDMGALIDALDSAELVKGMPTVIIADTIKGKGADFAEGKAAFHNASLTQEQFDSAKAQITVG